MLQNKNIPGGSQCTIIKMYPGLVFLKKKILCKYSFLNDKINFLLLPVVIFQLFTEDSLDRIELSNVEN